MALTSSMEDYLEAVLILHQKRGSVRGVDIAVTFRGYKAFCKPGCQGIVQIRAYYQKYRWHTLPHRFRLANRYTDL